MRVFFRGYNKINRVAKKNARDTFVETNCINALHRIVCVCVRTGETTNVSGIKRHTTVHNNNRVLVSPPRQADQSFTTA